MKRSIIFPGFLLLLVVFTASLIVISGCGSVTSGGGGGGGSVALKGNIYVSDTTNRRILSIRLVTNEVTGSPEATLVTSIELSGAVNPTWMALRPDGSKLYVADEGSNKVYVIETGSDTVTAVVTACTTPRGMVFNADGSKLFVACSVGVDVAIIDTATDTFEGEIDNLYGEPHGIAYDALHNRVYVACYTGYIHYASADATSFSDYITLPYSYDVDMSPNGKVLYATTYSGGQVGYLASFEASTNSLIGSWEANLPGGGIDRGFRNLAVSPDGKYICSTMHDYSYIDVFDTQAPTVEPISAHNYGPGMVAFSPDSSRAYAVTQSNYIDIIDPAAGTSVGSIELPSSSYFGIVYKP